MAEAENQHRDTDTGILPDGVQKVAQVLVDFHIARRNFLIYPSTHDQVQRSLDRVYGRISRVLDQQSDITVVVHKSGLAVGENLLPAKTSVLKDLATVLKQYQIATLTFSQGLDKDELVRFLTLVVTDRDKIMNSGGIVDAVSHTNLPHIHIQAVDYSKLRVTDESQISRDTDDPDNEGSIWQKFVASMTQSNQQPGEDNQGDTTLDWDPEKLASMLNDQNVDVDQAVAQYEAIFESSCTMDGQPQAFADGLPQFQQMIKNLNPDLQQQFLSATFDQCGQLATMSDAAHLIDGLGGELIIRMIEQASDADKTISPSLLSFVKKMARSGAPVSGAGSDIVGGPLASDEVETLLDREQYDSYVDQGYAKLLSKIVSRQKASSAYQLQEELSDGLSPIQIHSHTGRAMMALMHNSQDIGVYRSWARQLTYLLDDLLESHAFEFLTQIMSQFSREKKGEDSERAKIAGLVLDRFSDPQLVARAVEIFHEFGDTVDPKAMAFLVALGEPVVVEIFEALDPNETFMEGDSLAAKVLENLAALTAKEAIARLNDPRPDYVCRMIRIIRRQGGSGFTESVRPLLDNADMEIRMEALATLIKFQNKWGIVRLRDLLKNPMAPEFHRAIQLASDYRVAEMLPQLTAYAERGGDTERQEAAIRALGKIGDPRAVPVLAKLARRRWSVSKKSRHHIKRVVFETLGSYPRQEVQALVHFGLKQNDDAIRLISEQLVRKWMTH